MEDPYEKLIVNKAELAWALNTFMEKEWASRWSPNRRFNAQNMVWDELKNHCLTYIDDDDSPNQARRK